MVGLVALGGIGKMSGQSPIPVLLGTGACANNGTATGNTGIGFNALNLNDTNENTAIGSQALQSTGIYPGMSSPCAQSTAEFQGSFNTAVGARALLNNQIGRYNCALGQKALEGNTVGYGNVALGRRSLETNTTGCNNVAVGYGALLSNNNSNNIAIGNSTPRNFTVGGNFNVFVGDQTAIHLTTGNFNTFIGSLIDVNATVTNPLDPNTVGVNTNNTIILADGQGLQRLLFTNRGFGGIGLGNNVKPQNTFEIRALAGSPTQAGFAASGLRLSSLPNTNFNTTPPSTNRRVLSVNGSGDVILVDDTIGGGTSNLSNSCANDYFLTKSDNTPDHNLICSQVYDQWNGSPIMLSRSCVYVGWGTSSGIPANNYTTFPTPYTLVSGLNPAGGRLKLQVNGNLKANGLWITSDSNFKTEIGPLDKPLDRVLALEGHHYEWDIANNNVEMNFDEAIHTGFIAQELEKVIPHLVIDQEMINDKGEKIVRKSVNYIELIPYLVEAIKAQNVMITDLQEKVDCLIDKVGCNTEKAKQESNNENSDLIRFGNTKIINVSPNPSRDIVTVSLNVEAGIENAMLQVHDINGKLLSSLNVKERGNDLTKSFQKDNFGSGVYIISLVVNDKSIDAKRIIFN
ncbi:tail fiber domain-containing protein [Flavobacterium sp.]